MGSQYTQIANIGFSMLIESNPRLFDIKSLVRVNDFSVEKTYYTDGVITSVISFKVN